jgi:hypothetical protein
MNGRRSLVINAIMALIQQEVRATVISTLPAKADCSTRGMSEISKK